MRDEELILDGEVKIFRTTTSGDVYQMRWYITNEKRYIVKSCGTRERKEAIENAKKIWRDLSSRSERGEKIFSITMNEFREKYLEFMREETKHGLSVGRLSNIRTHTNHLMRFIGKDRKVSSIESEKFTEYRDFRVNEKQVVGQRITKTVIRNEQASIKQMLNWGKSKGIIPKDFTYEFAKMRHMIGETRRNGMTEKEYKQITSVAKNWYKEIDGIDEKNAEIIYYRKSIRDFIVLLGNTGMRTQELLLLQNKDVSLFTKNKQDIAEIFVQSNTTKHKTKHVRRFACRRADVFRRRNEYEIEAERRDYVFNHFKENTHMRKDTLYKYWKELKYEVKKKFKDFNIEQDLYNIRHFFITFHLEKSSISPFRLADVVGSSVKEFENHYAHLNTIKTSLQMIGENPKFEKEEEIPSDDMDE
jgi:integrase